MSNYQIFRSVILLEEDPLVKDPTVTKISAVPKSTGAESTKPVSLEIYTDNETKGIEYSVLRCPSVFVQTVGEMCSDTEMIRLYEHFVLRGSVLLSTYWGEAFVMLDNKKEVGCTWQEAFVSIMKEYNNPTLSGKHSITNRNVLVHVSD